MDIIQDLAASSGDNKDLKISLTTSLILCCRNDQMYYQTLEFPLYFVFYRLLQYEWIFVIIIEIAATPVLAIVTSWENIVGNFGPYYSI